MMMRMTTPEVVPQCAAVTRWYFKLTLAPNGYSADISAVSCSLIAGAEGANVHWPVFTHKLMCPIQMHMV